MTTATSPNVGDPNLDGRTARRLANRDRILDTALDMVAEGAEVDVEAIAERADVSVRSVYNHFPTARELIAGMYERGTARIQPLIAEMPSPADPFDDRVRAFVKVWARVQEEIAPVRWRALIKEAEHPELQPELADLRKAHHAEMRRMFPEIDDRRDIAAVVAVTDALTWRALRRHQGLSVEAAREVVEQTIRRLRG